MPTAAQVSSAKEILQVLGYHKSRNIGSSSNTTLLPAKNDKPIIRYRGQIVKKTIAKKTVLEPSSEIKSNKPQRIYRGQVVYG